MLTAKDIMTTTPITLSPETDIRSAAKTLLEHRINGAPVVDAKGTLLGVLCQSDLIAQQKTLAVPSFLTILDGFIPLRSLDDLDREAEKISATTVGQAMTKKPRSVGPDTTVEEIATLMVEKKLYTLPVVEGGRLIGVVGKEDVLRTLLAGQNNG
jgi:CBS domain-containing protein